MIEAVVGHGRGTNPQKVGVHVDNSRNILLSNARPPNGGFGWVILIKSDRMTMPQCRRYRPMCNGSIDRQKRRAVDRQFIRLVHAHSHMSPSRHRGILPPKHRLGYRTVAFERRVAIVLTVDMVSSTETRSVHGEYRANLIERELNSLISKKTTALGGVFHRSTGDGGICIFDSVQTALEATDHLHDGCRHLAMEQGTDIALRIGISAGEVVRESAEAPLQGFVFLESARLCSSAEAGSSIAAAAALGLIRFEADGHRFGPELRVPCRGITELVPAHRIERAPISDELPDILASERRVAMVGRAPDLSEVLGFIRTESDGPESRLVTLAGSPGIGKSRMLAELALDLTTSGLALGHACC